MMHFRRVLTLTAVVSAVAASVLLVGRAQEPGPPPPRILEQEVSAPAIDKGLLDGEPLADPGERGPRRIARGERVDQVAYARGKVIVKFNSTATREERDAAVGRAGATALTRPPHADFDVMARIDGNKVTVGMSDFFQKEAALLALKNLQCGPVMAFSRIFSVLRP